jgi:hypothetical protein
MPVSQISLSSFIQSVINDAEEAAVNKIDNLLEIFLGVADNDLGKKSFLLHLLSMSGERDLHSDDFLRILFLFNHKIFQCIQFQKNPFQTKENTKSWTNLYVHLDL